MARVTNAQKIAEYDRRRSDEYRQQQARAADKLRAMLDELSPTQTQLLLEYLNESEAEYRLVPNARFGGLTLERADTLYSCSVASEAYWAA